MTKLKIAFIKARWHAEIVDQAYVGFVAEMKAAGRDVQVAGYDVPGAFEMPLLAQKLAETGKFDAVMPLLRRRWWWMVAFTAMILWQRRW